MIAISRLSTMMFLAIFTSLPAQGTRSSESVHPSCIVIVAVAGPSWALLLCGCISAAVTTEGKLGPILE